MAHLFVFILSVGAIISLIYIINRNHTKTIQQLNNRVAKKTEQLRISNQELQTALDEMKTLRGVIPICSYCKSIRSDTGAWNQLEKYISENSEASFSHGICPKCEAEAREDAGLNE